MQRINVVGASGAGKSTFGAALAERLQGALVELDELFWRPGWQQAPNDEFRAAVDAALAVDRWVVCGNYNRRVRDIVWGRADTVVVVPQASVRSKKSRAAARARSRSASAASAGNV